MNNIESVDVVPVDHLTGATATRATALRDVVLPVPIGVDQLAGTACSNNCVSTVARTVHQLQLTIAISVTELTNRQGGYSRRQKVRETKNTHKNRAERENTH